MTRVLIIGATGFVGLPAAQALVRAGHVVYGLARTEEKAKLLTTEEIIPVLGDASDPSNWVHLIATIDVVIDAIGGTLEVRTLSLGVLDAVAKAAEQRPAGSAKVSYIYTSGTWVHGDDRKNYVSETTPLTNPAALVAWRPAVEQQVVKHTILNGIVIRPALVYGRSGSLLGFIFGTPTGKVTWPGTPGGRFSLVHTDDLATVYVLAAEKAQIIGGQIFDIANDVTESIDDILAKAVEISGASGWEYTKPSNPFEEALAITTLIKSNLAHSLLGWAPKKAGVIDGFETYYNTWKALSTK